MADSSQKITELENEIKVLKNEVKAILLDIREQYLNAENPFFSRPQETGTGPVINISNTPGLIEHEAHEPMSGVEEPIPDNIEVPDEEKTETPAVEETIPASEDKNGGKESTLPSLTLEPDEDDAPPKKDKRGKKDKSSPYSDTELSFENGGEELLQEINDYGIQEMLSSEERPAPRQKNNRGYNQRINLITIAGLSRWVDESTEKIGKERAEVMVEACHMVGHMSMELKDLVIRLVRLSQAEEPKKGKINTRDYLGVIAQLDSLLGYSNESEAALLSILTNSKETNSG
jgi:hypothetical protein